MPIFLMGTKISFLVTLTHFQMEKLRFRKVKSFFQAQTTRSGFGPQSARLQRPCSFHQTLWVRVLQCKGTFQSFSWSKFSTGRGTQELPSAVRTPGSVETDQRHKFELSLPTTVPRSYWRCIMTARGSLRGRAWGRCGTKDQVVQNGIIEYIWPA